MSQHPLAFWSLSTTDILRQLQMAKAFAYHKQEAYTIAQRLSCIAGTIPTRRIGIIGSGKMGAGLGRLWAKHGHYAMFSYSRRPEKLQDLVREIGSHARSGSVHNCTALVMYLMHNTPSHMKIEINGSPRKTRQSKSNVDPYVTDLLENIVEGKTILQLGKDVKVFSQGDSAKAIYFIQNGKVKVTVVSAMGNEAVLAILGPRGFLGEGCLVGQTLRVSTATAIQPTTIFRIERRAMLRALHAQSELSEKFIASLLARNIDLEEDLCDQLFNHSEKRLARVLLKLARFGQNNAMPVAKMPRLSHETLAEMVGTTRSRITHFMNKFRKLGLIDYNGEITVRAELLTDVVLHD